MQQEHVNSATPTDEQKERIARGYSFIEVLGRGMTFRPGIDPLLVKWSVEAEAIK